MKEQIQEKNQIKSNVLAETRERLASDLLTLAARIEAYKAGNYAWCGEFYGIYDVHPGFFEVFSDLISRTAHEKAIKEAKFRNMLLVDASQVYLKQDPKKEIDAGIKLARQYVSVLLSSGILHDHI